MSEPTTAVEFTYGELSQLISVLDIQVRPRYVKLSQNTWPLLGPEADRAREQLRAHDAFVGRLVQAKMSVTPTEVGQS